MEPPLVTFGSGTFPPPRVISQSMQCEPGKPGHMKTFTLTFVVQTYDERVEATIAAVAGDGMSNAKGGHLSIDFLANREQRTEN